MTSFHAGRGLIALLIIIAAPSVLIFASTFAGTRLLFLSRSAIYSPKNKIGCEVKRKKIGRCDGPAGAKKSKQPSGRSHGSVSTCRMCPMLTGTDITRSQYKSNMGSPGYSHRSWKHSDPLINICATALVIAVTNLLFLLFLWYVVWMRIPFMVAVATRVAPHYHEEKESEKNGQDGRCCGVTHLSVEFVWRLQNCWLPQNSACCFPFGFFGFVSQGLCPFSRVALVVTRSSSTKNVCRRTEELFYSGQSAFSRGFITCPKDPTLLSNSFTECRTLMLC